MERRNFLFGTLAGLFGGLTFGRKTQATEAEVAPQPGEPGSCLQWAELPVGVPQGRPFCTDRLIVQYTQNGDTVHGHVDGYEHIWGLSKTLEGLLKQIVTQVESLTDNMVTLSWFTDYTTPRERWVGHKLTRDERDRFIEVSLERSALIYPLESWQQDMAVCLMAATQVYLMTPTDLMHNTRHSKQHRLFSNSITFSRYADALPGLDEAKLPPLLRSLPYWRGCAATSARKNFAVDGPSDLGVYSYGGLKPHDYRHKRKRTAYPRSAEYAVPVNYVTMPVLLDRLCCPRVVSESEPEATLNHSQLFELQTDLWNQARNRLTDHRTSTIASRYLSLSEILWGHATPSSPDAVLSVGLVAGDEPFKRHFNDGELVSS